MLGRQRHGLPRMVYSRWSGPYGFLKWHVGMGNPQSDYGSETMNIFGVLVMLVVGVTWILVLALAGRVILDHIPKR